MPRPSRAAAALVALAAASVTAACGSSTTGSSSDTSPPGSAPSSAASSSSAPQLSGTVTVLAAASLTEAFNTLAKQFEAEHPGVTVKISYGASSALALQITQGAPADVFASA